MEVIFHPEYLEHRQHGTHPERPDRLKAVLHRLEKEGLHENIEVPEPADREDVAVVHDEKYIDNVKDLAPGYIDGGDTYLTEDTYDIAMLSAGGALMSLKKAEEGIKNMALLRPPGHHSGRDYGGGFCYFNNIAIAAKRSKFDRVAILDIDAHHGNGTSDIFYKDRSVLYISEHHHGIYPGTGESFAIGEDEGQGFNVNIPFGTGSGDTSVELAWDNLVEPILRQYSPDIILVSLGTDGHYSDVMTGLSYSSQCYVETAKKTMDLADEICDGRVSFMLEGGYHLDSLSEIVAGIVGYDVGKDVKLEYTKVSDNHQKGRNAVEDSFESLYKYWELEEMIK